MLSPRLFMLQRLSALLMAPLVFGHLAVMIYAIDGGLDAAEILGRTQGSVFWAGFYGLFVLAVSMHAAIGMRVVASEWLQLRGGMLEWLTWVIGLLLLIMGMSAVLAVVHA